MQNVDWLKETAISNIYESLFETNIVMIHLQEFITDPQNSLNILNEFLSFCIDENFEINHFKDYTK